ncbi:hypothetical protein [Kordiimonas sp.]
MRHETIATEIEPPEIKTVYEPPAAESTRIWRWMLATAALCIVLGFTAG